MTEQEIYNRLKVEVEDLKMAESRYSRYDFYTDRAIIEVKSRNREYSTHLIEKKKWDALFEERDKSGRVPFYLVDTSTRLLLFNLEQVGEPEWEIQSHNKNTWWGGEKTDKLVGFLPTEKAVEIEYE